MTGRLQILEWFRILYYCILCYYILRRDQRKCNIEKCNNGDLLPFYLLQFPLLQLLQRCVLLSQEMEIKKIDIQNSAFFKLKHKSIPWICFRSSFIFGELCD